MLQRDFLGYGLLLTVSLGAAYYAARPTSGQDLDRVEIVKVDPKLVRELSYQSAAEKVTITRAGDSDAYWVRHEALSPVPGTPAMQEFRASERIRDVLAFFNPLEALRVVPNVADAELEEFGLKTAPASLAIQGADGVLLELQIGKKSYGSSNVFARDTKSQRVMLIAGQYLDYVGKAPAQLFERNLISKPLDEYTRVSIKSGKDSLGLVPAPRDKDGGMQWRVDADGTTPKASFRTWLDKVAGLRTVVYATAEDKKLLASIEPRLEIAFEKNGAVLDTLTFRVLAQAGQQSAVWVSSTYAMTDVKLGENRAEPVLKDLSAILSDAK